MPLGILAWDTRLFCKWLLEYRGRILLAATPSWCTGWILSWASSVGQQYWRQMIAGFWHHLDVLDWSYHGPPVFVSSIGGRILLASDTIRMYWMDPIMGLQCLSAVPETEVCWFPTKGQTVSFLSYYNISCLGGRGGLTKGRFVWWNMFLTSY